jgi:NADH dehydrogenase
VTGAADRHRVVIVGGGFAGVRAAKELAGADVEVTLIDRTNHHLFQPLLYQVATGVLSPGQIAPALRSLFRRQPNVRVLLGDVEDIDLERRVVRAIAEDETELAYDTLVVAAGAAHSYFGHDEWSHIAPGMKTLDDANRLRSRVLAAFELAEQETGHGDREALMTFAIVGAGPTGVELAGQIAVLADRVLRGEYRHIDTRNTRVLLLDAAPAVLGPFPKRLRERAERDLRELGVEVRLGTAAVAIDAEGLTVAHEGEEERIAARTVIWAAGVKASPLAALLADRTGAETDRAGRLKVHPDLTLPNHPEVFALGDMIVLPDVPGTAQPAIQQGKYVARAIRARLAGSGPMKPFKYRDLGNMATIGRTRAVADLFGRLRLGGFPAFVVWSAVHLAYLVGWGNRFEAVGRWMWTILARNRRERLISVVSLVSEEVALEGVTQLRAAARERDQDIGESAESPTGSTLDRMPEVGRLLVLAGAAVADMDELPPSVRKLLDAADRVRVVTPPLPSRIEWLMSDTDRAMHEADARLERIFEQLASGNVEAEGTVGDDTPVTLVEDHVRAFRPDHLLVALRSPEHAAWQERGLLEDIAASSRIPMTVFEIDRDGHARDRSAG